MTWNTFVTIALFVLLTEVIAHSTASSDELVYLVLPKRCLNNIFEASCIKATISKLLGYAIITGACVVKVPQIIAFLRSKSVKGMSRGAVYFDLLAYLLTAGYHILHGNPFSAYGETVIITVQSIVIVLLMWTYDFPGTTHSSVVTALLAVAASVPFGLPFEQLKYVLFASTSLLILSRLQQIWANLSAGTTGQLAFLTLFMNFAGAAARIFTSSQEVKEKEVLISNAISTLLNLILVLQYVYYNFLASKSASKVAEKPAATTEAEAPPSSKKAGKAQASEQQADAPSSKKGAKPSEKAEKAGEEAEDDAPKSSSSSTRRRGPRI